MSRTVVPFDFLTRTPPSYPPKPHAAHTETRYDRYVDALCAFVEHVDHGSRIDTDLSDLDLDTLRSEAIA